SLVSSKRVQKRNVAFLDAELYCVVALRTNFHSAQRG
ncbi:MAG: hypothetical protein ACI8VW_003813, partial [bacterium]